MSEAIREAVPSESDATPARGPAVSPIRKLPEWLRSNLFMQAGSDSPGWRKIALAIAIVIAGAAVSLARTEGPGALNTTWIEDSKDLISQALYLPLWKSVQLAFGYYYQVPARVVTQFAVELFPLAWVPGVMSTVAALEYAAFGLVAYIASGPFLRNRWLRVFMVVPVVMLPLAYTQSNDDLVTTQFFGLYVTFWILLWRPGTRAGKIAAPAVMLIVATETPLTAVFAPLVLGRLIADRSRTAISVATVWFLGLVLEYSPLLEGSGASRVKNSNSPVWVAKGYVTRVLPRALFGEKALGGSGADVNGRAAPLQITSVDGHLALIAAAWAVMALAIVFALTRLTRPNWTLVVVAAVFSVGIFFEELLLNVHVLQPRYMIAPALLCYVVLAAALQPRNVPDGNARAKLARWLPALAVGVLIAVAVTSNFRVWNQRSTSPPWSSVVSKAGQECEAHPDADYYHYRHVWWWVNIPCDKVQNFWDTYNRGIGA